MAENIVYNLSKMKRVYFNGEIDDGVWSVDRYEDGRLEVETDTDSELEKVARQAADLVIHCGDNITRIQVSRVVAPENASHEGDHYFIGLTISDKDFEDFLRSFHRNYQELRNKKTKKVYSGGTL